MCGIAGFLNYPQGDINSIHKFLYHRGPDEQSSYTFKNLSLVHTRLSIQDIFQGTQPYIIGNWVIIFNGEIYNHLSLRKELKEHEFMTQSDTETFLALYIKYGDLALTMCDGMFAFAILDIQKENLILGRDRSGKKPLYYYKKKDTFIFASELNALNGSIQELNVDSSEIYSYLRNGFFYGNKTPFQDVFAVLPGTTLTVSLQKVQLHQETYFDILQFYKKSKVDDFDLALEEVDNCLHSSVRNRLLSSDLEVGAFLSGGIDSSLIVAIASEYVDSLKTFTVKFDGVFDESSLARLTAEKYDTEHTEISISMNLRDDIEKILLNYGEPFMDSSAIPSYYVSEAAKKHVTVILNGDGADELFGGYRRYVPIANNWINLAKIFSFLNKLLPKPSQKQSYYNYLFRLLKLSGREGLAFYNTATNDLLEDVISFDSNDTFRDIEECIQKIDEESISNLSKILIKDFKLILPCDLLKKMDIATMSNSMEGRSPFLSKDMLELAPTLKDKFKVNGLNTKFILRELGKKYLPKEIINQPKRGFEVPLTKWVNNDLNENILDRVRTDSYSSQFLPLNFIDDLVNRKIDLSEDGRAKVLWSLFCLEVWKENL